MIVFNEHKYAVEMNDNPKSKHYTFPELVVYTKWLKQFIFKNYPEEQSRELVKKALLSFCAECWSGFNEDIMFEKINKIIEQSFRIKLRTCNPIYISKKEWEKIISIDSVKAQKIFFTILVISKFNRFNPIETYEPQNEIIYKDNRLRLNIPDTDIYKYAKVRFKNKEEKYACWRKLRLLELVYIKDSKKISRIINFADLEIPEEEIFITIKDFDNLILYYEKNINKTNIKECVGCNSLFEDNSIKNNIKYCKKCRENKKTQRVVFCEDCGKRFEVNILDAQTNRCKQCYKQHRKNKNKS